MQPLNQTLRWPTGRTTKIGKAGGNMANLSLDRAKTAVLSMDIQKAPVRRSAMFKERNVGQAAKSVLEAARKAGVLIIHAAIDYQPAFFSPKNRFLQKIRIPILSAPGVDVAELLAIV